MHQSHFSITSCNLQTSAKEKTEQQQQQNTHTLKGYLTCILCEFRLNTRVKSLLIREEKRTRCFGRQLFLESQQVHIWERPAAPGCQHSRTRARQRRCLERTREPYGNLRAVLCTVRQGALGQGRSLRAPCHANEFIQLSRQSSWELGLEARGMQKAACSQPARAIA